MEPLPSALPLQIIVFDPQFDHCCQRGKAIRYDADRAPVPQARNLRGFRPLALCTDSGCAAASRSACGASRPFGAAWRRSAVYAVPECAVIGHPAGLSNSFPQRKAPRWILRSTAIAAGPLTTAIKRNPNSAWMKSRVSLSRDKLPGANF